MRIQNLKLVVLDMSGTTIVDENEVMDAFHQALRDSGLQRSDEEMNAMMGWSKFEVFRRIWAQELSNPEAIEAEAQLTFGFFNHHIDKYYATHQVTPTEGCLDLFAALRQANVRIALNTGFRRKIVDDIINQLGWRRDGIIDFAIASDEVPQGRPAPFMIQRAMKEFGLKDPKQVVKIGDTPVDLQEGRNAGCVGVFGLTNGTHRAEELAPIDNDGLFSSLADFQQWLFNLS
jgi:phosphonatase-like hydrolase